jgi:tellurite resistance protein TerA
MVELKAKVTLKNSGEEAYISLKQLMVTLRWTMNIDLDLMAFYKAKDGRTGGVFSDNYPGGSLGSLNGFPFIQLSGDAGLGGAGGDNEETIRIAKLDDMAEVYICTINYDDAIKNVASSFSNYDGGVIVLDDKGESVAVPLNSPDKGHVAIIVKIDNTSPMGAKLINQNKVVDLGTFASTIPGADQITS